MQSKESNAMTRNHELTMYALDIFAEHGEHTAQRIAVDLADQLQQRLDRIDTGHPAEPQADTTVTEPAPDVVMLKDRGGNRWQRVPHTDKWVSVTNIEGQYDYTELTGPLTPVVPYRYAAGDKPLHEPEHHQRVQDSDGDIWRFDATVDKWRYSMLTEPWRFLNAKYGTVTIID